MSASRAAAMLRSSGEISLTGARLCETSCGRVLVAGAHQGPGGSVTRSRGRAPVSAQLGLFEPEIGLRLQAIGLAARRLRRALCARFDAYGCNSRAAHLGGRRQRQGARRQPKKPRQEPVAAHGEVRQHTRHGDGLARYLDFYATRVARMTNNLAQGKHRKANGPQTEAADAPLAARYQQCVRQRVAQVRVGNTDELLHAGGEARIVALGGQLLDVEAVAGKELLWQPTSAAAAVLPDVLQNIRHLQSLRKGCRKFMHGLAVTGDIRGVAAEKIR